MKVCKSDGIKEIKGKSSRMKISKKFPDLIRRLSTLVILILMVGSFFQPSPAHSTDLSASASAAVMKLVHFCNNPVTGFDVQAASTLLDSVLASKSKREAALPQLLDCPGAYYEFDTMIKFQNFLEYSYNPQIPSALTRPTSLRYSLWTGPGGEWNRMPDISKLTSPMSGQTIVHGFQHDSNTPDLTTGVYHEYDLKRSMILINHKGQRALISISKQIRPSNVGKKGAILGIDDQWHYYYSGEPGSQMSGLGWVKSYIYDYFSIIVYIDPGASPERIKTGVFQWLRAGWSGINFVRTRHILEGLKRYARGSKSILESPNLPAPSQMASAYQTFLSLPQSDLLEKYTVLRLAQQSSALLAGKITPREIKKKDFFTNVSREQMVEELMLEYLKSTLGMRSGTVS